VRGALKKKSAPTRILSEEQLRSEWSSVLRMSSNAVLLHHISKAEFQHASSGIGMRNGPVSACDIVCLRLFQKYSV
jgi:hypothetical protein